MAEENDGLIVVSSDSPEPAEPTPGAPALQQEPVEAASPPAEPSDDEIPESVSPRELRRLVGRITAQRTAMEKELGATRAQVDTLMRLIQPASEAPEAQPTGPPRRPRQSDYATDEAFDAAEEQYHSNMVDYRLAEREALQRQSQVAQSQAELDAERTRAIQAREAELVRSTPDYYDRFERLGPQLAPHVLWALQQAGAHGPDLVLHLSQHQQEVERLNAVPAHLIGVELGMLRGPRSDTPAPTGAPNASPRLPEPPQPVGGGGAIATTAYRDDMSQEQYDAWVKRTYPHMPYTWRK